MKEKSKVKSLRGYASLTLEKIRDECRKNEISELYQASGKKLLMEASENYRRRNQTVRNFSTVKSHSHNKTTRTEVSSYLNKITNPYHATQRTYYRKNNRILKSTNVGNFFLSDNWCSEDSDEAKV